MRITKDLLSGLLFAGFGLGTIAVSSSYRLGTAQQMGPGFFPMAVGGIVAAIGLVLFVRALLDPASSEPVGMWDVHPLVFVLAAILAFSLLIDSRGLIAAVAALLVVSRVAGRESRLLELAVMVVVLCAIAYAIFVWGLGIPFRLVPW